MNSDKQILLTSLMERDEVILEVLGVNFFPFTYGGDVSKGILINKEDFPLLDQNKSLAMDYRLYYNKATNKAYYEYFEQPKTEEDMLKEEIKELKLQQETTDKITADLAYELMMLKGAK